MVIEKAYDFISFKIGEIKFLDILNIFGEARFLDSFLKANKASETKVFSLMSSLTVRKSLRMKIYLHTKPFSVNRETATLLIKTLRIIRIRDQVDLMNSKH